MNADDMQALMGVFLAESQEFLQILETEVLQLESSHTPQTISQSVKALFRAAHSLKGSASMFGFQDLSVAAHCLEDCFGILRDNNVSAIEAEIVTQLLQGVDYLKALLDPIGDPNSTVNPEEVSQFLTSLKQELERQYSSPRKAVNTDFEANQTIIKAIFEGELPIVLETFSALLAEVTPDNLIPTTEKLSHLQEQLAGVASMLQLSALQELANSWQVLLNASPLILDTLQGEGAILLEALDRLHQQVVEGQTSVLTASSSVPTVETKDGFADAIALMLDSSATEAIADSEVKELSQGSDEAIAIDLPSPSSQTIAVEPLPESLSVASTLKRSPKTIRVDLQQLNELINLVGELVINRTNLALQADGLKGETKQMRQQIGRLQRSGVSLREEYDRLTLPQIHHHNTAGFDSLEWDSYSEFHSTAQTMLETSQGLNGSATQLDRVAFGLETSIDRLQQIAHQLQNRVMQLRVVPFSRVVDRLPRAIRDLSRTHNKEVNLLLLGRDTRIDESLLEALQAPLLHLLRNAFDHGIESPEERVAAGKLPSGSIEIEARHQGGQTLIIVSDDGRGIDPQLLRQRIVEKGLASREQVASLSASELYEYLFLPGFSTAKRVTDLSGRGVGLDVVKANLQQIRGNIKIESSLGKGTTFILKLPLMLSIIPALMVQTGQEKLAVPLDAVEEILQVESRQMQKVGTQEVLEWRDNYIQLVSLSDLLHYGSMPAEKTESGKIPVLILASSSGRVAIKVDRLWGQQEIVVKPFPAPLVKPSGIAGSTILGTGDVVPILDVDDVFSYISAKTHKSKPNPANIVPTEEVAQTTPASILVVDDAYTIRQLLSRTLGRANYRTVEAQDGQDAIEQLRRGLQCDLIVTDLEMPRLDGFELLRALKADPQLQTIPAIVLTSRTGNKYRTLAEELGAAYYLTKPYREEELLEAIARLVIAHP